MTKRDAIEAMVRAMEMHLWADSDALFMAARDAYERLAEMAKAERKAQSTPSTPVPTA